MGYACTSSSSSCSKSYTRARAPNRRDFKAIERTPSGPFSPGGSVYQHPHGDFHGGKRPFKGDGESEYRLKPLV